MNKSEIAERAAREILATFNQCEPAGGRVTKRLTEIVERAIAESRGQWIPVEEKLPKLEHGGVGLCRCLFYVESTERQFSGYFDPLYSDWIIAIEDEHTQHQVADVTHWMAVPDPPKGSENV